GSATAEVNKGTPNDNNNYKESLSTRKINSQMQTRAKKCRRKKPYDFSNSRQRRVALQVCYFGWDYYGLQRQPDVGATIESHLFEALEKTCLVENRDTCQYNRCGRTDKGVSAFAQTVSINVRTKLTNPRGLITAESVVREGPPPEVEQPPLPETEDATPAATATIIASDTAAVYDDDADELCFVRMLNGVLPRDIRVTAWAPVSDDFNARFDCSSRTYKYYFISTGLNVPAMDEAASHLVGTHDFRNFCKIDTTKHVANHVRTIHSFTIGRTTQLENPSSELYTDADVLEFTIVGTSFLWHQVRCMVGVLFLVGQGRESSQTIDTLLDITKCKGRPQYNMAPEGPLVLYDSQYKDPQWRHNKDSHKLLMRSLTEQYTTHAMRATMARTFLNRLRTATLHTDKGGDVVPWTQVEEEMLSAPVPHHYKPLLSRNISTTVEAAFERKAKKQKLESDSASNSGHK
ncbi:hypothetical protein SARC_12548, partial [Sphaeroforma arctica JP610]